MENYLIVQVMIMFYLMKKLRELTNFAQVINRFCLPTIIVLQQQMTIFPRKISQNTLFVDIDFVLYVDLTSRTVQMINRQILIACLYRLFSSLNHCLSQRY